MPGVQRLGDINMLGGAIVFPNQFGVLANFRPVAVGPALVAPHKGCPKKRRHCVAVTVPLTFSVRAQFLPVVKDFDFDTCGDLRILGSFDVQVGFL